ncbi:hypothetical protein IAT38_001280 [Cryptococcus sp. DSM 104549]
MSAHYGDPYNDPYARQAPQGNDHGQYADHQQAQHNPPYGYNNDSNPYGEEPRYPSYPADPSGESYAPNPSTEKMVDDIQYEGGTERAQPGRSRLRPTTSFAEMGPPPRSTGILRVWRKDERGKQWSRGGGVRMSLRMCCCCLTIAIIMIISIILSIALVSAHVYRQRLTSISFDLSISVSNPNWFDANFKEITATARYPGNNTNSFGGGTLYNLDFKGYTESTFNFPFTLNYTLAKDPNKVILTDLILQDITVDYDLELKLKVLGVTLSPTISNSASFECPITSSDIESIIGSSS